MKTEFKQFDWCFCEFKLQQIQEIEKGRITSVSDGIVQMSGFDLSDRCFPLDMTIKQASDAASYWREKFFQLRNNGLNHPDLNRALIERWVVICENKDNKEALTSLYEKLNIFGKAVCDMVNNFHHERIEGVSLFRS